MDNVKQLAKSKSKRSKKGKQKHSHYTPPPGATTTTTTTTTSDSSSVVVAASAPQVDDAQKPELTGNDFSRRKVEPNSFRFAGEEELASVPQEETEERVLEKVKDVAVARLDQSQRDKVQTKQKAFEKAEREKMERDAQKVNVETVPQANVGGPVTGKEDVGSLMNMLDDLI